MGFIAACSEFLNWIAIVSNAEVLNSVRKEMKVKAAQGPIFRLSLSFPATDRA